MNRSECAKKVGPPQKNSLDPLLILWYLVVSDTDNIILKIPYLVDPWVDLNKLTFYIKIIQEKKDMNHSDINSFESHLIGQCEYIKSF